MTTSSASTALDKHNHRMITFTVDGEPVSTNDKTLTPRQIMELAHVDPAGHYLVRIEGRHQVSYKDNPEAEIPLHQGEVFITVSTAPRTVS